MFRVLRNFAWLTGASVLSQAFGAIALIYASRRLGPSLFGLLAMAQAVANLGLSVADMGLGRLGTRLIATGEELDAGFNMVVLRSCLNLVCLSVIAAGCLILRLPSIQTEVILLSASATAGIAFAPDFVWTGIQSLATFSKVQVIQQVLRAGGIVAGLWLTGSIFSVPLATLAAGVGAAALLWVLLPGPTRRIQLRPRSWRGYLVAGIPIGLTAMMPDIYINGDSLMVRAFLGFRALGQYAAAYRLLLILLTLAGLFVASLFPELCRVAGDPSRLGQLVQRALHICVAGAVPVAVLALLVPGRIMTLVYGASYAGGAGAARLLLLVPVVAMPNLVLSSVLIAVGRTRFNLVAIVVGGIVNLGLDAILLPRVGTPGAAAATLIAEMLVLVALWYAVRPGFGFVTALELATCGAITAGTVILTGGFPIGVTVAVAGIVYFVCLARSRTGRDLFSLIRPAPSLASAPS